MKKWVSLFCVLTVLTLLLGLVPVGVTAEDAAEAAHERGPRRAASSGASRFSCAQGAASLSGRARRYLPSSLWARRLAA